MVQQLLSLSHLFKSTVSPSWIPPSRALPLHTVELNHCLSSCQLYFDVCIFQPLCAAVRSVMKVLTTLTCCGEDWVLKGMQACLAGGDLGAHINFVFFHCCTLIKILGILLLKRDHTMSVVRPLTNFQTRIGNTEEDKFYRDEDSKHACRLW